MSKKLTEKINNLDDFQVTRFFNHFSQKIFSTLDTNEDELKENVPIEIKEKKEFLPILNIPNNKKGKMLDAKHASVCARNILVAIAQQVDLQELLSKELEEFKDDEMFGGIILSVALAAAMILFVATTKGKATYINGKWEIEIGKNTATPKLVEKVLNPLAKAAINIGS